MRRRFRSKTSISMSCAIRRRSTSIEQQVAANTESVRVTQARVTAGAAAEYDLLTAQTTLSNSQQQLSSARNTLALAEVNLNNLIGLTPTTPIALQAPAASAAEPDIQHAAAHADGFCPPPGTAPGGQQHRHRPASDQTGRVKPSAVSEHCRQRQLQRPCFRFLAARHPEPVRRAGHPAV